jgi:hypothetical protein
MRGIHSSFLDNLPSEKHVKPVFLCSQTDNRYCFSLKNETPALKDETMAHELSPLVKEVLATKAPLLLIRYTFNVRNAITRAAGQSHFLGNGSF